VYLTYTDVETDSHSPIMIPMNKHEKLISTSELEYLTIQGSDKNRLITSMVG